MNGIIRPGSPIGDFNFNGDLVMSPLSEVDIDIGGTDPGITYDRLVVDGEVTFGGAVQVLLSGYTPQLGDVFDVIESDFVATLAGRRDFGGREFRLKSVASREIDYKTALGYKNVREPRPPVETFVRRWRTRGDGRSNGSSAISSFWPRPPRRVR